MRKALPLRVRVSPGHEPIAQRKKPSTWGTPIHPRLNPETITLNGLLWLRGYSYPSAALVVYAPFSQKHPMFYQGALDKAHIINYSLVTSLTCDRHSGLFRSLGAFFLISWEPFWHPRPLGKRFWHFGSILGSHFGTSRLPRDAILAPRDHPGRP